MLTQSRTTKICQSCTRDLLRLFEQGFCTTPSRPARRFPPTPSRDPQIRPFQSVRIFSKSTNRSIDDSEDSATAKLWKIQAQERGLPTAESQINHYQGQEEQGFKEVEESPEPGKIPVESAVEKVLEEDEDPLEIKREGLDTETIVRQVRQRYGESLPLNTLSEAEYDVYLRLYGEPIDLEAASELDAAEDEVDLETEEGPDPHQLFREDVDGGLQAVRSDVDITGLVQEEVDERDKAAVGNEGALEDVQEDPVSPSEEQARALEVATHLQGQLIDGKSSYDEDSSNEANLRMHPFTTAGKFGTFPATVSLPRDTFIGPVSTILSDYSNKQLSEVAHRAFGGPGLPHSTMTPMSKRNLQQVPIPLEASQHGMGEMEANAYLAAIMPGVYSSVMSTLIEVRKRLGRDWIRELCYKEGGPQVLDAGAGGAGILAWREVLKADWPTLNPDAPETVPFPLGKSTVLTGSDTLRHRSSALLENTTFLPRLPDYVHVRDSPTLHDETAPPKRKQYDLIIAPHTLWSLQEDYLRKQHVQNLWSLLNPAGGVLILIEKGVPRGFEMIGGARDLLLERFISSPGSTEYENLIQEAQDNRFIHKGTGMIIAPCTNHGKCPMYLTPGVSKGRKDFCHFEQRFIRPPFLQRILGATDRNHEDVKFSYVAAQKGVDQRKTAGLVQGNEATDNAFAGLVDDGDVEGEGSAARTSSMPINTLALPRTILPPIKRRGHVILDVCTPAGRLERWTVPRSWGRQPYRDARKSQWGDLWALGAKTRIPRNVRLGKKKEVEEKAEMEESGLDEEDEDLKDWDDSLSKGTEDSIRSGKKGKIASKRNPPSAAMVMKHEKAKRRKVESKEKSRSRATALAMGEM